MKKRRKITGLAALFFLLVSIFPVTAFASESGGTSASQLTLTVSVSGYSSDVDGGQAQTALPDGTEITVQGGGEINGLLFVVEPVEESIHNWILQCMEGKGTNIRAYDIYFLDENGNRYEITEPVTLTFSLNGEYRNPAVYYISESGAVQRMDTSVSGDQITFTTDHNSYYALAEQAGAEETGDSGQSSGGSGSQQTGSSTTGDTSGGTSGTDSPKTGDDTAAGFWTGAMTVSAILALSCLMIYRRKRV